MDFVGGLTEDQIEVRVSLEVDRTDSAFLRGCFNHKEYIKRMAAITAWSEKELRFKSRAATGDQHNGNS